jgi:hypothetical protein
MGKARQLVQVYLGSDREKLRLQQIFVFINLHSWNLKLAV